MNHSVTLVTFLKESSFVMTYFECPGANKSQMLTFLLKFFVEGKFEFNLLFFAGPSCSRSNPWTDI